MSLIPRPTRFVPASCSLELSTNQRIGASPFGGSEQATDLLNDRWMMTVQLPASTPLDAGAREAFLDRMRNQTNWVALYHFARQQPRGTARGTQVLSATAAQGAASISISGVSPSNGTYLAGDMLGVGGLLLRCAEDCLASSGVITVPLVNRLRFALSSGAAVTYVRPTANFRLASHSGVQNTAGLGSSTTLEFREAIGV